MNAVHRGAQVSAVPTKSFHRACAYMAFEFSASDSYGINPLARITQAQNLLYGKPIVDMIGSIFKHTVDDC